MKKIALLMLLGLPLFTFGQPVPFLYIDTLCDSPPALVNVPVKVNSFDNISSTSFTLSYDTANNNLVYQGYLTHPLLTDGFVVVNNFQGKLSFAWFNLMPLDLPDEDTLVSFTFQHNQDSCYLNFDSVPPGTCSNGLIIPSAITLFQQPQDIISIEGQTSVFDVVTSTLGAVIQWQYSMDGGNSWMDLPEAPPFYGVNSSVLIIDTVPLSFNQYLFRARFLNCSTATSDPALLTVLPNAAFNGVISYQNNLSSPLHNVVITLEQNGVPVYSATTDASGAFLFPNIQWGSYDLRYTIPYPWAGVNASDALMILTHSVGMTALSGLPLQAADINLSGLANAVDALLAIKRFAGSINNFLPAGDWQFNLNSVFIAPGTQLTQDIKTLCTGDVNGSYIP